MEVSRRVGGPIRYETKTIRDNVAVTNEEPATQTTAAAASTDVVMEDEDDKEGWERGGEAGGEGWE